ncbi:hypothetical protein [Parasitella parasitica]|uniref:Uncharacterized protein n=1 Tax=Parasitella parasitica TaxID=35722 RepID=A0A0B7MTS4_9FUNG|nr:hypothetical protein [Parasitella parasitica]
MYKVLIAFLLLTIAFAAADEATTNALVSINNPKENQMLAPGQQLILQYTINGFPPNNGASHVDPAPNYPSSLEVYLKWTKNDQNIQLRAAGGLVTAAKAGGNSRMYNRPWKLPNCHFFRRYMPSEWSFSLVFDPQYPASKTTTANNMSNSAHTPLITLGPKQSQIIIPISIKFNATAMTDSRHSGC